MHCVQVPLDGTDGQSGLLPQRSNQADQVDPQTLLAYCHTLQLPFGSTALATKGTGAGYVDVLHNLHRNLGQLDHFPGALGPTPRQRCAATGTLLHHVLHSMGGRHAGSGKALATRPAGFLWLGRFPVLFGLQTGHPSRALALGLPFQLGNPFLQKCNGGLLLGDNVDQDVPASGLEINFPFHPTCMT